MNIPFEDIRTLEGHSWSSRLVGEIRLGRIEMSEESINILPTLDHPKVSRPLTEISLTKGTTYVVRLAASNALY
jgi:hypothetical protein